MMEHKRVLIVHNYYQIPGGEDTVVENEKKLLENHGHTVFVYTRNNSELKSMSVLRKLLLPFTTIYNPKTAKDIKKIIREKQIDIVHVHNTLNLISPSVYYAAKGCKVPVIQTMHNFRLLCPGATFYRNGHVCEECVRHGLYRAIKHKCYRQSRLQTLVCVINTWIHRKTGIYGKINYICLTEFNRDKLLNLKQVKPERVFVKPNFVGNIGMFIPEEKRKKQYVFIGRLDKLKGIDILFNAWKEMGKSAPKLVVYGTGTMEKWCEEFLKQNHVNIELKGFVCNEEIRKIVADSLALILPTQWYEGFPMSIVEAYSVGTPVICSDLGNGGSIVSEMVTGCKFEPDNCGELILAVNRCKGLCESTLDVYKQKYSETQNYHMLVDIYSRVEK